MSGNNLYKPWGTLESVRPVKRVADLFRRGASEDEAKKVLSDFEVSPEKQALAIFLAKREIEILSQVSSHDVALYIDIPFCPSKCAYCAFASLPKEQMKQFAEPYLAALYREFDAGSYLLKKLGFTVKSVYIGGGTPTTLLALELDNLLYKIRQTFDLSHCTEFTVEAGRPDTLTPEKLSVMKKGGVTRISINPQTVHNKTLERIGRRHTNESFLEGVSMAKETGGLSINMDIIAGLPGETLQEFKETLSVVSGLMPDNITMHTLSIKRASRLKEEAYTPTDTVRGETAAMVNFAYPYLQEKGYMPYYLYRQKHMLSGAENTGFAKGNTACLYNIGMMEDAMPVFGFGVGAVTKLVKPGRIERIFNVKDVAEYIKRQGEMRERKNYALAFYNKK